MAKQRWKAVKLKQKFDRQRFKNFTGRYSEDNMFISKVQHEKYDKYKYKYSEDNMFISIGDSPRFNNQQKNTKRWHCIAGWERKGDLRSRGGSWHRSLCLRSPGFYSFTLTWVWAIVQAYKNHWVLRTSPDDWFFPVIRRIAQVTQDFEWNATLTMTPFL